MENQVGSGLEYSVLGPVEAARDGVPVPIPGAKQRTLLAALLLEANRVVSAERLIARLWEQDPPAQARNALQNHIKRLRQVLIGGSRPGSVPDPITTRPDGYLMTVPEQALDLSRFTALVRRAESTAADGRPVDAAALYGEALAQWRGEPLRETSSAALRGEYAGALTERRLATIEARIELELRLGRHERVLAELAELTAALPLREKFWSQRLLALYRSGRQAEALNAYQSAAAVLADELGVDPGAALREMHQAILTDALAVQAPPAVPDARDAHGAAAGTRQLPPAASRFVGRRAEPENPDDPAATGKAAVRAPVPPARHDLPAAPPQFTGRAAQIAALAASDPVAWAIDGMAGIGKTALALHVAHRSVAARLDGGLYLDLHGHTAGRDPLSSVAALETLLRAAGVAPRRIPEELDERAGLWRSVLAERRTVLVLDNAADEAQVRPLLPGTASTALFVTSRRRLAGLDGVRTLSLGVLTEEEAIALLRGFIGPTRVAAEPEACAELVRLCGGLPLAVRVCAARLAHRPAWTVQRLVDRLGAEGRKIVELGVGDIGVASALTLSLVHLDVAARRVFELVGSAPGPVVDRHITAALIDRDPGEAERLLEELVDAHLLEQFDADRYRAHDLVLEFARGQDVAERTTAVARMVDYCIRCAVVAVAAFDPYYASITAAVQLEYEPAYAPIPDDGEAAVAWLDDQVDNLVGAARAAAAADQPGRVIALARAANRFFLLHGRTQEWLAMSTLALTAAEQTGDILDQVWCLLALGAAHRRAGNLREALQVLQRGSDLCREQGPGQDEGFILNALATVQGDLWLLSDAEHTYRAAAEFFDARGHRRGAATAWSNLATVLLRQGRAEEALDRVRAALEIHETDQQQLGLAYALLVMGDVLYQTGADSSAEMYYRRCLDVASRSSIQEALAAAHNALARIARDRGNLPAAFEHHRVVAEIVERTAGHAELAKFLNDRASTHLAAGDPEAAEAAGLEALARATKLGNPVETERARKLLAASRAQLSSSEADLGLPAG